MIGETFAGRYVLSHLLGEGGMGAVYAGHDTDTGRSVAVKVLLDPVADDDALVRRFEMEAKVTGELRSQHIAEVIDAGVDDEHGTPFLVMELLSGEDFERTLDRLRRVPPELAARVAAQACAGLTRAHAAQVIHRDVKPANIFLAERAGGERVVKLLDFGVAKMSGDRLGVESITRTGAVIGSPLYMSPEQARGRRDVDHRSDIFSLGVVLYRAVAGRTPFEHIEAIGELIIVLNAQHAPPVTEVAPATPRALAALIDRALRIDPDERFQSAAEMYEALADIVRGRVAIDASMIVAQADDGAPQVPAGTSAPPAYETEAKTLVRYPPSAGTLAPFCETLPPPSQPHVGSAGLLEPIAPSPEPPPRTSAGLASRAPARRPWALAGVVAVTAVAAVLVALLTGTAPRPGSGSAGTAPEGSSASAAPPPPPAPPATSTSAAIANGAMDPRAIATSGSARVPAGSAAPHAPVAPVHPPIRAPGLATARDAGPPAWPTVRSPGVGAVADPFGGARK